MIELCDSNLVGIGTIPVIGGSETRSLSSAYILDFEVRNKDLVRYGLKITPFSVFKYNNIYYRQTRFESSDNDIYTQRITCEDIFTTDLIEHSVRKYTITGDLEHQLSVVFEGTRFSVGGSLPATEAMFIEVYNNTRLGVFVHLAEVYGFEYRFDGTQVFIEKRFAEGVGFKAEKGVNIIDYSEVLDSLAMTTKLRYDSGDGGEIFSLESENFGLFPNKNAYMSFDPEEGDIHIQAKLWLKQNEEPKVSINLTLINTIKEILEPGRKIEIIGANSEFGAGALADYAPSVAPLRITAVTRDLTFESGQALTVENANMSFGAAMSSFVGGGSSSGGGSPGGGGSDGGGSLVPISYFGMTGNGGVKVDDVSYEWTVDGDGFVDMIKDSNDNYLIPDLPHKGQMTSEKFNSYILPAVFARGIGDTAFRATFNVEETLFKISLDYYEPYNFIVDWGDGTVSANEDNHDYTTEGVYQISIKGLVTEIDISDESELISIDSWGPLRSERMRFDNCHNLKKIASPIKYCESLTFLEFCFRECTGLTSIPHDFFINCVNVISFNSCFKDCTSLTSIPEKLFENCVNATVFDYCFDDCKALSGNAPRLWEMFPNATGYYCFRGCTGLSNYDEIPSNWK